MIALLLALQLSLSNCMRMGPNIHCDTMNMSQPMTSPPVHYDGTDWGAIVQRIRDNHRAKAESHSPCNASKSANAAFAVASTRSLHGRSCGTQGLTLTPTASPQRPDGALTCKSPPKFTRFEAGAGHMLRAVDAVKHYVSTTGPRSLFGLLALHPRPEARIEHRVHAKFKTSWPKQTDLVGHFAGIRRE